MEILQESVDLIDKQRERERRRERNRERERGRLREGGGMVVYKTQTVME